MANLSDLTYASLKEVTADWLAKSNLSERIPDFIYLAEKRLFKLKLLGFEDTQSGTLTGGVPTLALPTGASELRAVYLYEGQNTFTLRPKPPHVFFSTNDVRESATPAIMTVIGDNIHFGPIPDSSYSYVIHFVGKPQHLSDSVATNWLLTNFPDLYLYATLLEAEPFLKDDKRIAVWRDYLATGIEDAEAEDHETRYSGGDLIPSAG